MPDAGVGAKPGKPVLAGGRAPARAERAVEDFLATANLQ
jgi:hypothetical protein